MSDDNDDKDIPIASDRANEIADDSSLDDGTAIRKILALLVEVTENAMCTLWDVADALKLRTINGEKKTDS